MNASRSVVGQFCSVRLKICEAIVMLFFVHLLFLGIALYGMSLASMVSVKNLIKLGNEKIAGEKRSFLSFSKTLSVQTNVFGPVEFMYRGHHGGERIQSDSFLSDSNTTSDEALQFIFCCWRIHFDNCVDLLGVSLEPFLVYDTIEKFGFSSEESALFRI